MQRQYSADRDGLENGYRCIEPAQRLEPDVMLLDLRMPQFDGPAALEQLQTQDSAPKGRQPRS
ncbi:hypothetical protein C1H84_14945 [Glutamicibacter soli]|uniref:Response regulatory domain-containing protein n=1 Tax=Glutamicibacter soli TaxID=453836 RepID=A0A365YBJ8_9MICC|nr:hypothetical protein C1H84_14945 [Glutamicibacter soli]